MDLSSDQQDVALPAPTNLTVTNVNSQRQDLSWDPSPGATKYVIMIGNAPGTEVNYTSCCLNGPPFVANHLTPNTQYCWQVKNVNSLNQVSAPSNEVCMTTTASTTITPPATVNANAISSSRVSVDWTSVTGAVKYIVNESVGGGAYAVVGSTTGTTLVRTSLTAATQYCYTVQAVDSLNNTSVVSSPPACTTTFVQGLEGYWKFEDGSGSSATDSSGFGRTATLGGGAVFTSSNPQPYQPIDNSLYRLDATGATAVANTPSGIGAYRFSNAAPFTIMFWERFPTSASTVLFAGMRNTGACGAGTQGWEVSQGASGLQFIGETGTGNFGQSLPSDEWHHVAVSYAGGTNGTLRMYIDGVQTATMAYTAQNHLSGAVGFGHFGSCAGQGAMMDEIQILSREATPTEIATAGTRPPAPTSLTITATYSARMDLSWTAPASGAAKWIIRKGTAPGNEQFYTHAPNPPNTFIANHLTPSTQYSWDVITVNNNLLSVPSNEVVGTTLDAPAAPTGVTATGVSQTRINLSWNAVTNASKYIIAMSSSQAGPYTNIGVVLAPTTTFQATGLTAGTTYWFEVQAQDSTLTKGPFSTPVSGSTLP